MKKPFEVGDRVRVYSDSGIYQAKVFAIEPEGMLRVELLIGYRTVWAKQCRRLVKKKRREWWVNIYPHFTSHCYETKAAADSEATSTRQECIRVKEVKTKEKK